MIRRRRRRRQRGFTLIELMISLVLFALVTAGMFAVTITMARGFKTQESAITTEEAARAAMSYLSEAVRGLGPGAPTNNIRHVNTCAAGAITVTDGAAAPDTMTLVYSSGAVLTTLRTAYDVGTIQFTVADATQLASGDTLLISNLDQAHVVQVVAANPTSGVVTVAPQTCGSVNLPTGGYPAGSIVIRALRAEFEVGTVDGIPTLLMDPDAEGLATPEPLAEGIEDLQVAVAVDANSDGVITENGAAAGDDEWTFNVAGETLPAGTIRAVRITLVARASQIIPGPATFRRPAAEDHAAATAFDQFRRRVLTSTIEIRNFQGSP